ncbi:MAG: carboxypeptidase regulatory-like domain-containing protein [Actinomycetota bacterium]
MRSVKVVVAALLVAGLGLVWQRHEPVLAAYEREPNTERLQLRGVDLEQSLTDVGPSPYLIPVAADGRDRATALSVAEREPAAPPQVLTMLGGDAALTGSVAGPTGPQPGANVRIERHGPDGVSTADVVTDELGSWELTGVAGGRYRVRAWTDGGLTMERSVVFFLDDDGSRRLDLVLVEVASGPRAAFTTRGNVYLGLTASVAVSLTEHRVGADGVVEIAPLAGGKVTLTSPPGFTVTPAEASTDGSGVARFTVRCHRVGTAGANVGYLDWTGPVTLPPCVPRPAEPTETPPPDPAQSAIPLTRSGRAPAVAAAPAPAGDEPEPGGGDGA